MQNTAILTKTNNLEHLPKLVIGLSGKKGSGKDTIADNLVHSHGFKQIALADALKDACHAIFGTPITNDLKRDRTLYDKRFVVPVIGKRKKDDHVIRWTTMTVREILQQFGTECCRAWMRDIWIAACWTRIVRSDEDRIVISDVRFLNEVWFLQQLGVASVWKVIRPKMKQVDKHASENDLSRFRKFDVTIKNDGSIERLYTRTVNALKSAEKQIAAQEADVAKSIVYIEKGD